MSSDGEDDFEDDTSPADDWEEFREGDGDFIGLEELKQLDLSAMEPEADLEFTRVRGQLLSYEEAATWLRHTLAASA
jgi:hypothetical protein